METVGFIGLGTMGKPMARNLLGAGYPVTVFNRSPEPMQELAAEGAATASGPQELAEGSDVVILMLPDSPDVEAAVLGPGGVADGAREGTLVIDMSSIAPGTARLVHEKLAAKDVDCLDAPVSGGEAAAVSGELSIMVGGDEQSFARAEDLFAILGKVATHIGPAGAGQVAKAANQIVVGITIQAVAEALSLVEAAGVNPAVVRQALLGGFAQSKVMEVHGQRMIEKSFEPGFKLALHRKDLGIALETARETQIPLLATAQLAELMNRLIGAGEGDADHSAVSLFYGQATGAEARAR